MRDLLTIKQTNDVLEYAGRFEQARHRVLVHNKDMGEVFFVQKFLDGLKYNISNVISLHKPRTVDVVLSLALMQEEILEASSKRYSPRSRDWHKGQHKVNSSPSSEAGTNSGNVPISPRHDKTMGRPKWDEKLSALRAARRAKGLCMKCGEQYNPQHTCPAQVSLQILEEVLNSMEQSDSEDAKSDHQGQSSDEELLTLSWCVVSGVLGKKTIRLHGTVDSSEALILVDSGSSATFISEQFAINSKVALTVGTPTTMVVADGNKLTCTKVATNLSWWTQGHNFTSTTRVLPLAGYDIILGMDWLEQHSPMWVHWKRKKMRFSHLGKRITLTGVKEHTDSCPPLKAKKLTGLLRKGGIVRMVQLSKMTEATTAPSIPPSVQQLVDHNKALFQEPTSLPPQRPFDHAIPLVPRVKPVNLKPYRYIPTQKDEIERQVKEMLLNGVIQPSSSPFASL
jgi:hypothetical protein